MRKNLNDEELSEIEGWMEGLYFQDLARFSNEEHRELISRLEKRKRGLLYEKEVIWRLKSRALWLEQGHENRYFFHQFANQGENVNTLWKN